MADVGSLWFSVLYKDDPKQLDQIKERALKKLQDMNLVTKVSGTVNKKELIDSVASALSGQQFKIGVEVDKADIKLPVQIKELGEFSYQVDIHSKVQIEGIISVLLEEVKKEEEKSKRPGKRRQISKSVKD